MAKTKYNILKAASWYTAGNILIKGVGFFVLPIFTRIMSTHEYGIYSIYTSYLTIFEVIILMGLSATVALAKYAKEVEFDSYISTVVAIPSLLTLGCMFLANPYLVFLGDILSMDATLWNCLFISAGAASVGNIINARLVIEGRYKLYMSFSGLNTVTSVAFSLLLCYTVFREHDIHLGRVFGSTAATVLCTAYIILVTRTKFCLDRLNVKYAFMWGVPLLFHTVATVVLTQSDRILIRYMDSYSSVGIYAIATTLVAIPMVLQHSFAQAWSPWFYGKLDSRDYVQLRWLNNRYIVLYAAIIAGFMLLVPNIVYIFTATEYWDSVYSLVPLSVCAFAELMYSIPTSTEYYYKKTTFIMTATLIAVVINIILDVVLIRLYGYHGAAYATALSKVVLFLLHYYFARKLDSNDMFSKPLVAASFFILFLLDGLVITTLTYPVIRYIILGLLSLVVGRYLYKMKDTLLCKLREKT